ncbi:hypothetical protein KUCAC02_000622 [Chaenocephalus aceratus]|uniref:Uncharacterized protein n=1 Tax=Chaenocephalus aceratus TaxID=36190 RepID=A0ACB9W6V7_CHAAC|nr:hypothetical protein KUCAC02_000622 [Chaenocephalus aceratus]
MKKAAVFTFVVCWAVSGNYNLTDKSGMCLRAQMAVLIRLATPKANGTSSFNQNDQSNWKLFGKIRNSEPDLTEGFIYFRFNKSAAEVFVDELSFSLYYPFAKDDKTAYTASNKSLRLFPAKIGHSYSCKNESIYLGSGLSLEVNQDRMQAYNLTRAAILACKILIQAFQDLCRPCAADKSDYRVAIAVGVTLLILIIIVLVAYLLGRRRKTGGYQPL